MRTSMYCAAAVAAPSSLMPVRSFPDTSLTLRNLLMINDRLAAHSFKQQSFPREKILYIRNERSERLFLYLPFKITFCEHPPPLLL